MNNLRRRFRRRNRNLNIALTVTVLFCIIALTSAIIQSSKIKSAFVPVESINSVVIDPGHGGIDGGAQSESGLAEKNINLDISLKLRDLLLISGFDVIMTRDTDISIHDPSAKTAAKKKTSDLNNRLKIINSNENALLISVHQNHFSQEKYSGAQMFYGTKNPHSEALAQMLQDSFVKYLQPDNIREIKKADSNLYLMKNAKIPAVLVECGFLSNQNEAYLLSLDEYRSKIAFVIYSGILNFKNGEKLI